MSASCAERGREGGEGASGATADADAEAVRFNVLAHRRIVPLGGRPHQRSLAILVGGGGARTRGEQCAEHLGRGLGTGLGASLGTGLGASLGTGCRHRLRLRLRLRHRLRLQAQAAGSA